jgi:A-kinase anchor protein 10
VQYLESRNGLPLVKFWLDCEALKALSSDGKSIRTESCNGNKLKEDDTVSSATSCSESNLDETEVNSSNEGNENSKVNGQQKSFIEPMTQSLTDDEKSKIFCEKNQKKVKKNAPSIQEDALGIYRKYLVTDSIDSIELPATILSKLSLALCDSKECDDENTLNLWEAFDDAQKHVMDIMEKDFLANFLESSFYFKYTVDVLTSDTLNLSEILQSEAALFFFMEFLEQEDKNNCKLPYLEFWLAATNFRKQNDQSLQQMREDALVIYEKWFSLQATNSLQISNRVRTKVEESICSLDPTIIHCFDIPISIVEIYLENSSFKKFIKSQLFFKHLSEVMIKAEGNENAQNNGILKRSLSSSLKFQTKTQHRRTRSDATKAISSQNTLLAGLDHRKTSKNSTDLQIDARQLDPDMLWRRKSSGGLSFGRVDALGRYRRDDDYELPSSTDKSSISQSKSAFQLKTDSIDVDDPQSLLELNSTHNKFKNVMRKLVHLPEDDMQQEIAWQVAEMIVKDVTSITLSSENSL